MDFSISSTTISTFFNMSDTSQSASQNVSLYRFARLRFRLSTSMHCRPCRPFADISLESTRNLAPEHAAHTPRAAHGELTARAQHTPFLDETPFKPGQDSHLCSICEAHILMRKYRSPFSRGNGRLAQRERRCLTSTRSQVQILYRPPLSYRRSGKSFA